MRVVHRPRMLATVVEIARAAGDVLRQGFAGGPAAMLGARHGAATKSAEFDLVTELDRRSEALVVERLRSAFPGDAVIAEEGGGHAGVGNARWLVDPLDGTTNFAHGLPMFAVSIARERDDPAGRSESGPLHSRVVDLGVVYAPILDLMFTAIRGSGAFCNDRRLRVSETTALNTAMLATGFPSDRAVTGDTNFPQFMAIKQQARAVRRLGCSTLEQAFVAAGTYDGFWEMKLKAWDLAAGSLLVEEAGGRATGWAGEPLRLERGAVIASNGKIHDDIVSLIANAGIPAAAR